MGLYIYYITHLITLAFLYEYLTTKIYTKIVKQKTIYI